MTPPRASDFQQCSLSRSGLRLTFRILQRARYCHDGLPFCRSSNHSTSYVDTEAGVSMIARGVVTLRTRQN